jgi:hypothetical protein
MVGTCFTIWKLKNYLENFGDKKLKLALINVHADKNMYNQSESRRFLRELFMYRYSQLLLAVEKHYPLTTDQKTKLYKTILNLEWIDSCFEQV